MSSKPTVQEVAGLVGGFSVELIMRALLLYKRQAADAETNAAHAGLTHDNGAREMRDKAEAYWKGLSREVPDWLEPEIAKARLEEDPEYQEYRRLKQKFENK